MVDEGKYLDAIEAYNSAIDSSNNNKTISQSLLQKAMTLSMHLNLPDEALLIYDRIYYEFPQMADSALYQKALLLFESSRFKESIKIMHNYQRQFPDGKFIFHIEAILNKAYLLIDKKIKTEQYETEPILRVLISKNGKQKQIDNIKIVSTSMKVYHKDTLVITGDEFEFYNKNNKIIVYHNKKPVHSGLIEEIDIESNHLIEFASKKKYRLLRGNLHLKAVKGKIRVINYVLIEDYLRSVVPSESIPSWPEETLKAQTIAARTYAYKKVLTRRKFDFDLYDDTWDQVYGGVKKETKKTDKIIQKTRGIIIVSYR